MPKARPAPSAATQARLEGLAREYRPALTRFFRKRARQPADVDDLVQEVLLRLAVRGDGESIDQPEAYLMRTATNVWRDFLRGECKRFGRRYRLLDRTILWPTGSKPGRAKFFS